MINMIFYNIFITIYVLAMKILWMMNLAIKIFLDQIYFMMSD